MRDGNKILHNTLVWQCVLDPESLTSGAGCGRDVPRRIQYGMNPALSGKRGEYHSIYCAGKRGSLPECDILSSSRNFLILPDTRSAAGAAGSVSRGPGGRIHPKEPRQTIPSTTRGVAVHPEESKHLGMPQSIAKVADQGKPPRVRNPPGPRHTPGTERST